MLLDLSRIQGVRERFAREYEPSAFDATRDDFRVVDTVRAAFDVEKSGSRYRLAGTVATTLELPCSRCAEPVRLPVDAPFDVTYLPQAANAGEQEQEIDEEHLDVAFYEDERIDLVQLWREQLYLSLPMKPLCAEDCRGLCPVCGTNRNTASCDCRTGWEDPRLAPLKGLLEPPRTG